LKLLGRAEDETRRLRQAADELRANTLGVLRIAFLSSAVLELFSALGIAGVALYVGLSYLGFLHLHAAPLSLQAGLFCLLMAPEVYAPLRQFAAHYHDRAAAVAVVESLDRLFEGLPPLTIEETPAPTVVRGHCNALSVVASGVALRTPDGAQSILADGECVVTPGAHVAILGASGAGKSTLLEAFAGLRAYSGRIELGGVPLDDWPEPELRRRVALLGQRPRLFHGTIADNISFANPNASAGEVRAAAERAGVMRFAAKLPDGLDTPVGDGGLGLSGGEAHRVALARIFVRNPDLILLDEPTAHLDRDTEAFVLDSILDFAVGKTLVIATHSNAVAEGMDRVLRVEAQRIFAVPHRRRTAASQSRKGVA
jgi:ATP-binding cassette subfamily C protein CydD